LAAPRPRCARTDGFGLTPSHTGAHNRSPCCRRLTTDLSSPEHHPARCAGSFAVSRPVGPKPFTACSSAASSYVKIIATEPGQPHALANRHAKGRHVCHAQQDIRCLLRILTKSNADSASSRTRIPLQDERPSQSKANRSGRWVRHT
jgi:hypothetical protein